MATRNAVYHNPNLRSEVSGWRVVGENVAAGPSIGEIHDGMMKSSSHRANVLDGEYREVGVGVAYGKTAIFVSQVFVLRSGAPRVAVAPRRGPSRVAVVARPPRRRVSAPSVPVRTVDMLLELLRLDPPAGVAGR